MCKNTLHFHFDVKSDLDFFFCKISPTRTECMLIHYLTKPLSDFQTLAVLIKWMRGRNAVERGREVNQWVGELKESMKQPWRGLQRDGGGWETWLMRVGGWRTRWRWAESEEIQGRPQFVYERSHILLKSIRINGWFIFCKKYWVLYQFLYE